MTTALFLLDMALDALMLVLAIRLADGRIKPVRIGAASLAGALTAQIVRLLPFSRGQAAWLWLPGAMGMMAIACGRRAIAHPLRHAMLLLCAAGLLGGVVLSLYGATGSLITAYALGGVCTLVIAGHAWRQRRIGQSVKHVRVTCRYRGRTTAFDAMVDSGNTLRDYLTRLPVIVMPEAAGRRLFHLGDDVLRPIFADTAGGRQMMGVLAPQEIIIEGNGLRRYVRAVAALSPGMREGTPALVPAALLEESEAEEFEGIKSRGG